MLSSEVSAVFTVVCSVLVLDGLHCFALSPLPRMRDCCYMFYLFYWCCSHVLASFLMFSSAQIICCFYVSYFLRLTPKYIYWSSNFRDVLPVCQLMLWWKVKKWLLLSSLCWSSGTMLLIKTVKVQWENSSLLNTIMQQYLSATVSIHMHPRSSILQVGLGALVPVAFSVQVIVL